MFVTDSELKEVLRLVEIITGDNSVDRLKENYSKIENANQDERVLIYNKVIDYLRVVYDVSDVIGKFVKYIKWFNIYEFMSYIASYDLKYYECDYILTRNPILVSNEYINEVLSSSNSELKIKFVNGLKDLTNEDKVKIIRNCIDTNDVRTILFACDRFEDEFLKDYIDEIVNCVLNFNSSTFIGLAFDKFKTILSEENKNDLVNGIINIENNSSKDKGIVIYSFLMGHIKYLSQDNMNKLVDVLVEDALLENIMFCVLNIKGLNEQNVSSLADRVIATKQALFISNFARAIKTPMPVVMKKLVDELIALEAIDELTGIYNGNQGNQRVR